MSKVLAIAGANLKLFLRDRSNIFFVFIFPIGLIFITGLAFGGQSGGETIGVSAGSGPLTERFLESLAARPGVRVERVESEATLRDRVERGTYAAGVLLPPDLAARLARGEEVALSFFATEGGGAQYRLPVMAALSEVAERVRAATFVARRTGEALEGALARVEGVAARGPVAIVRRERVGESAFGSEIQPFDIGAGSQLVLFIFLTGLTSSSSLIRSRRLGVSRRMLASPTSPLTIVVGEGVGRFVVALFQGLYIIAATWLLFDVDWGDPLAAALLLLLFCAVAAGAGMLVGAIFENDQQAGGVSVMVGLGLAALGGAMVPLEVYGDTMRAVARFVPHSWAVDGYGVLLRHGGGVGDVLPHLGVLALFATGFLLLAAWRFRAKLLRG